MAVTVTPQTFTYVIFDAAVVQRVAEELAAALGLADQQIVVDIDETTPLARTTIDLSDGLHIRADSGALEDTRKPRQHSETAIQTSLGRVLLRARDRMTGGFGEAPPDHDLSLAQIAAWEVYCIGRLERIGVAVNRQRWLYNFRNRHGFTDGGDASFEELWQSDGLTWGELCAISQRALDETKATT